MKVVKKNNSKSKVGRLKKELKDNEKLYDCISRIASETVTTNSGEKISNMEIISRQIVNGSRKGDYRMLSLFCDLMKTQELTIEQYSFDIPQFIYNININD